MFSAPSFLLSWNINFPSIVTLYKGKKKPLGDYNEEIDIFWKVDDSYKCTGVKRGCSQKVLCGYNFLALYIKKSNTIINKGEVLFYLVLVKKGSQRRKAE